MTKHQKHENELALTLADIRIARAELEYWQDIYDKVDTGVCPRSGNERCAMYLKRIIETGRKMEGHTEKLAGLA